MAALGKCFGVALIVMGGLSVILGSVSIGFCIAEVKFIGAPIWSGIFLMITGSVGLMTGFRPRSSGWMTGFLVLSILAMVVVVLSAPFILRGLVFDSQRLHNGDGDYYMYDDVWPMDDHLNWPEMSELFDSYSDGDDSSAFEWEDWEDLVEHFNLPDGWEERPEEMQDWLGGLEDQMHDQNDGLNLPDDWEEMVDAMHEWAENQMPHTLEHEETEGQSRIGGDSHPDDSNEEIGEIPPPPPPPAAPRHGGGHSGGRPRPNGDRDGDEDWYDDDRFFDHHGKHKARISVALFGVSVLLAFIEFVVLFASSASACCGLCNSSSYSPNGKTGVPQVFVLQPGQTMLPQTNGQFIIVQRPPSYRETDFTPSTNPALDAFPTKAPSNRLPPLQDIPGIEEAEPLPEKVDLA